MNNVYKLYKITNERVKKSINIEDSLYEELKCLVTNVYDATISDVINICLENYIDKNKPSYYEKPKGETVTYRSIMIRKDNLNWLRATQKKTGISLTRLLNDAVKEFLEDYKK